MNLKRNRLKFRHIFFTGFFFLFSVICYGQTPVENITRYSDKPRSIINFNREWKFSLGDIKDGQDTGFNDKKWETVGIPHSFSIPYFMSKDFYIGYGWYRKTFRLKDTLKNKKLFIEFEGAFQETELFVNGKRVGVHKGGYTGFIFDITPYIKQGNNLIAVRVNNNWRPDVAPRAGEHVFSGGIYRDVRLIMTNPIHLDWNGIFITTPEVGEANATVKVQTDIKSYLLKNMDVRLQTTILDPFGKQVVVFNQKAVVAGNHVTTIESKRLIVSRPKLWHPDHPYLYKAIIAIYSGSRKVDEKEQSFGIRSIQWTRDRGFLLNGKRLYLRGANAHQDQAGWGDAVTNAGFYRDVKQIKDAGFNFIRGSHYPHDPAFADACDKLGILFWSESPFWGIGGSDRTPEGYWNSSSYPTNARDTAGFNKSISETVRDMILINRNHPSIIAWSVSNEPFFTAKGTMPSVRALLKRLVKIVHEEDPTRPAAIGGCQRPIDSNRIDLIGDVAGYNGDGATINAFQNPGVPSIVSEYGSISSDRPGDYLPGWVSLSADSGKDIHPWRSGQAIWCGFDHGSIAGANLGKMGIIDYFRLPKRAWYWYRNHYLNIPPPEWPKEGTPAALKLEADKVVAGSDGTDDIWLKVTVLDKNGKPISNSPDVKLEIVSGPGEFPTGTSIQFSNKSDIRIQDGKAAISFRSWYAGKTVIKASSLGLQSAEIVVHFTGNYPYQEGITPKPVNRPYTPFVREKESTLQNFGPNNPTFASSSGDSSSSAYAADGNPMTFWQPSPNDKSPCFTIDTEKKLSLKEILLSFPRKDIYQYKAEISIDGLKWKLISDESKNLQSELNKKIEIDNQDARFVRVRFIKAENAALSEVEVTGKVL